MPRGQLLCHRQPNQIAAPRFWVPGRGGGQVAPSPEDPGEGARAPLPFWEGEAHPQQVSGGMYEELLSGTAPIPAVSGHRALAGGTEGGHGWIKMGGQAAVVPRAGTALASLPPN